MIDSTNPESVRAIPTLTELLRVGAAAAPDFNVEQSARYGPRYRKRDIKGEDTMQNRLHGFKAALLTGVLLTVPTTAAFAQDTPATQAPVEEEIVVTARRSSERLIQVPVQVNVATSAQLSRVNANTLEKISENIPFVAITRLPAGNGGGFNIRGIGNYGTDSGVQQSVLLSVDDNFVGRPRIVNGAMFDLKQVEVLKGPQALFYGKNTVAGVISVSSADPTSTLSVRGTAGYEFNAREKFAEAAISGPIADTLSARLAVRADQTEGWLKNVVVAAVNPLAPAEANLNPGPDRSRGPYSRDIAARLTLLWAPSSDFQAKFKYFHDDNRNGGEASAQEIFCQPGVAPYREFNAVPDTQVDCKVNRITQINDYNAVRASGMPGSNGGRAYGTAISDLSSLKLTYISGPVTLTSVTGYYKLSTDSAANLAFSSLASVWAAIRERSDGLSQEIRVSTNFAGKFNVMGGVFLANNTTYYNTNAVTFPLPFDAVGKTYESYRRFSDQTNRTYSGFVQAQWAILDTLKLEGGLRYSKEKVSATDGNSYVHPFALVLPIVLRPQGQYFVRSKTESNVSPEVTLTWHPTTDQTLYGAFKTGNKPGGFSFPALATVAFTEARTNFQAEKVKGFEVGYKAELLNRALRVSLTGYHFKYTNQQTATFNPAVLGFTVQNAAASIVQGVEAEANWTPSRNLSIHAGVGYNDAHYENYKGVQCHALQPRSPTTGCTPLGQDLSGKTLPRAAKWAGDLGVTYDRSISKGLKIFTSANTVYAGDYNPSDTLDPFLATRGYFRVNASLAIGAGDGGWEVGIYGRNLTDQYKPAFAGDNALGQPGTYGGVFTRPREVLISAKFQY